jgi:uncharacterized membrane protein YesL
VRAFKVAWKALVAYYNELFFMVGISVIWWITGGVFLGIASIMMLSGLNLVVKGELAGQAGPLMVLPLLAIPAGPATAALAVVTRRVARELHVDRSFYFEGFRMYWRKALALSAIGMGVLVLLLLNLTFYFNQPNALLQAVSFLWMYLILFWLAMGLYVFPILVGMENPTVLGALKTSALAAFANPLFTLLLLLLAIALTAVSVVLAILVILAWPAVMLLLGEQSIRLFLERAGVKPDETGSLGDNS